MARRGDPRWNAPKKDERRVSQPQQPRQPLPPLGQPEPAAGRCAASRTEGRREPTRAAASPSVPNATQPEPTAGAAELGRITRVTTKRLLPQLHHQHTDNTVCTPRRPRAAPPTCPQVARPGSSITDRDPEHPVPGVGHMGRPLVAYGQLPAHPVHLIACSNACGAEEPPSSHAIALAC